MKKLLSIFAMFLSMTFLCSSVFAQYNFGDMKSETLAKKAWEALAKNDLEGVLAYTGKCLELYGAKAEEMQKGLTTYPTGANEKIFSFWALNDVATCLFIQGEAYHRAGKDKEAVEAYKKLVDKYSFGQTFDTNGWFWKPADAAKEKMSQIDTGLNVDFGDYSSSYLVGQAWRALPSGDVKVVTTYTDKVIELYAAKAKEMQGSLTEYPWQSKEQIFNFWALNDVGTALYIKGQVLAKAGQKDEAKAVYKTLVDEFSFAQCWDPQGWFWKPAEAAQEALAQL
ncbi:MAG: tetratricopeptide repeat protein [Candidatus Omnitrophica bacterium]|nr:tetratricopeptide repeat protein [Candidatus Omnitrophota bacterium]